MAKKKSEQIDRVLDKLQIRLTTTKNVELFSQFENLIETKRAEEMKNGSKFKIVKNDFYQEALILGIKQFLMENLSDDIAEISKKALDKTLVPKISKMNRRHDLEFIHLSKELEKVNSLLNYMFRVISSLDNQFEIATNNGERLDSKYLETPLVLEEWENNVDSKWRNKIRMDISNEKLMQTLELEE